VSFLIYCDLNRRLTMPPLLGRLKDVTDVTKVAPDGQTIEGRMQELCKNVAEDIKKCANTCDTYLKLVEFRSFLPMLTILLERRFS